MKTAADMFESVKTKREVHPAVGNPDIKLLVNTKAVHPARVIAGEQSYPTTEEIVHFCESLS